MTKPSVSAVKNWETVYDSDLVLVSSGTFETYADYWAIKNKQTNKKKYFYGESAYVNARREASDIDSGAWSM